MSYLPDQVDDAELLTNYVDEDDKIKNHEITWRAFRPGRDGERSVYRNDGLSDESILDIGRAFVGLQKNRPIFGWGQVPAGFVRAQAPLRVRADEPPPRHAVIDLWPSDPEAIRGLCMALARVARTTEV